MTRFFSLVLAGCLCAALLFCGCSGETSGQDGVMTAVRNESGTVTGYQTVYHNDNGDLSRVDFYDADQVYDHFVVYEYDSQNRLIQETTYRADGIGDFYYTYVYDDGGVLTEKGYFTMSDGAVRTLLGPDGSETERYTYDSADTLIRHEIFTDGAWTEIPPEEDETTE